jgi:hypothetical protein
VQNRLNRVIQPKSAGNLRIRRDDRQVSGSADTPADRFAAREKGY